MSASPDVSFRRLRPARRRLARPAWVGGLVFAAGCSGGDPTQTNLEFLPEMVDSIPYDSFSPSPVTRDGKTLMAPPKGAVPRGFSPLHFAPGPEEAARAGRELVNPTPDTPARVARGQVLYRRFCSSCHGASGAGDGPVVPAFPTPPSLTLPHATGMPDGQIFHVVTFGQGLMPAHRQQISQADRWDLVRYVRSLQKGSGGGGKP